MTRGAPVALPLGLVLAMALAACEPANPAPSGSALPGPGGSGSSVTPAPPETLGQPPSPSPPDEADPVVIDATLLEWLPASIDGTPVTESIDEAALAITDPSLPAIVSALDAAVAVDPGSANLVYALVLRLRPRVFSEVYFSQWRDSFDEGACAAGGGALGRAEATIDDRRVFITSCVSGLRTYHVWLEEPGILISASSLGEGRFGEKLMDNLRVPA